jgi:hypothetical protein
MDANLTVIRLVAACVLVSAPFAAAAQYSAPQADEYPLAACQRTAERFGTLSRACKQIDNKKGEYRESWEQAADFMKTVQEERRALNCIEPDKLDKAESARCSLLDRTWTWASDRHNYMFKQLQAEQVRYEQTCAGMKGDSELEALKKIIDRCVIAHEQRMKESLREAERRRPPAGQQPTPTQPSEASVLDRIPVLGPRIPSVGTAADAAREAVESKKKPRKKTATRTRTRAKRVTRVQRTRPPTGQEVYDPAAAAAATAVIIGIMGSGIMQPRGPSGPTIRCHPRPGGGRPHCAAY